MGPTSRNGRGDFPYGDAAIFTALFQRLEQLAHLHVVGISGRVVLAYGDRQLRRLANERHVLRPTISEKLPKWLDSDSALSDERVAILVRCKIALAVVEVEEAGRLARSLLELVEHLC